MTMLSSLDLIRRVPLFSMLTNDQAQGIADSVVKKRFRRGEIIVEHGRKSNALFILLNGRARVLTADSRGREVILAVLQPGDYVGEMSLIDDAPHSATVRAEVQTDMLVLGRAEFARCLPESSSLSYAIMHGLVQRLRAADRQIESLALLDVYGRVARALLEMAETDGERKIIRNKVSRQDLAKVVGASREMVSRVMKDLEERGMIETLETGSVVIKQRLTATERALADARRRADGATIRRMTFPLGSLGCAARRPRRPTAPTSAGPAAAAPARIGRARRTRWRAQTLVLRRRRAVAAGAAGAGDARRRRRRVLDLRAARRHAQPGRRRRAPGSPTWRCSASATRPGGAWRWRCAPGSVRWRGCCAPTPPRPATNRTAVALAVLARRRAAARRELRARVDAALPVGGAPARPRRRRARLHARPAEHEAARLRRLGRAVDRRAAGRRCRSRSASPGSPLAERIGARLEGVREQRVERIERAEDARLGEEALREREQVVEVEKLLQDEHLPIVIEPAVIEVPKSSRVVEGAPEAALRRARRHQAAAGRPARRRAGPQRERDARHARDDLAHDREEAEGLRRRGARRRRLARAGDHALRDRAGHRRQGLAGASTWRRTWRAA